MKNKVKKAINLVVKRIEKFLKKIYHKLPISHNFKTKAKNLYFTVFGFCLKNTPSYIVWKQTRVKKKKKKTIDFEQFKSFKFDKTIGIHLHLFYVDLLEEFISYLNNIPYTFDLFISVINEEFIAEIEQKVSAIKNVKNVKIKKVENRGRDVAPLVVDFAQELQKYDYVCHIHSKKSLYTGREQVGWRGYLLDGLMGSEALVTNIFYRFEINPDVGLIYPETYAGIAYIGHSWLCNNKSRDVLLSRLGIIGAKIPKYIDFPMGTMFWARGEAVKRFFKAGLKTTDFPEEAGQNDGTIAHAFERCLGFVTKYEGYTVMTYDEETGEFSYGYGRKNMQQYWSKTKELLESEAFEADIVSFDIFDTLLMRKIVNPDDLFDIIELKINKSLGINIPYKKYRKKAEKNLRKSNSKPDYTIFEIYEEFQAITSLPNEVINQIMDMEVNTEKAFLVPREEMKEVYYEIINHQKKDVLIISDMYFTKSILETLLKCNGIEAYKEILVSSEMGYRKDNGTMWDYMVEQYPNKEMLHIGDNEVSDAQLPGDRGIKVNHILSAKDLFLLSNVGRVFNVNSLTPVDSVAMGILLNKYLNSPYILNKTKFQWKINNPYDLGYAIIGPVVCDYLVWLVKNVKKTANKHILMLAREGYLLKNIFDVMKEHCEGMEDISAHYVYTSRRAILVASIKNEDDIKEALNVFYEGKFSKLMKNRFGIDNIQGGDEEVVLPSDAVRIYERVKVYLKEILSKAQFERNNYLKYISEIIKTGEGASVADLGYSGSIQYYLSKLLERPLDGYYFATDNKRLPLKIAGSKMSGRYIENDEIAPASTSYIHRYSLILEAVLTSMDNQLCYIDENIKPVFLQVEKNSIDKNIIKEIHTGAAEYAKELFGLIGDVILYANNDKAVYEELIRMAVEENLLTEDMKKIFILEDDFCANEKIDIFKRYEK